MPLDKLSSDKVTVPDGLESTDAHGANPTGNFSVNGDNAGSDCQCVPEIKVGPCSSGVRVRRNGRAKKRPALRTGTRLIQILLSGVIGLAAGGFVLFLINPDHPLIESLSNMVHGEMTTEEGDQPQVRTEPPNPAENTPSPNANVNSTPIKTPKAGPTTPVPVAVDAPTEENEHDSTSQVVSQPATVEQDNEKTGDAVPAVSPKEYETMVLDPSKPRMRVTLSSIDSDADVSVKIAKVVGLGASYALNPTQGLVDRRHPVDIVLPNHAGARIRVALHKRQEKHVIEVSPELLLTESKWVPLTQDRLKGLHKVWEKKKRKADMELAAIKIRIAQLQNAIRQASGQAAKNLRQQHDVLKQKGIPQQEQKIKAVEQRILALKQLSELLERIDGEAEIHYTVQPQGKGAAS